MNTHQLILQKSVYALSAIKITLQKENLEKDCIIKEDKKNSILIFNTTKSDVENNSLKNAILATMVEEIIIP